LKVVDCNLADVVAGGGNSTYVHIEGCSWSRVARNGITHAIAGAAYGVQTTDLAAAENVGVSIVDNMIHLTALDFGIYLGGAGATDTDFVVSGNEIYFGVTGAAGIFSNNLVESVISSNVVNDCLSGFTTLGNVLGGSYGLNISENVFKDCTTGIDISGAHAEHTIINANIIDDALGHGITGAVTAGPLSVTNNNIDNPATDGIYFSAGNELLIKGNRIDSAGSNGIQLDNSAESAVVGNLIAAGGSHSIYLNTCTQCTVSTNGCNDSAGDGILINGGSNNVITGNSCVGHVGEGINLANTLKNTVTGNNCSGNNSGIVVTTCTVCAVSGNTCNDNLAHGIYFDNDWGSLTGNVCTLNGTVAGAGNYGILLPVTATDNAVSGNNVSVSGDLVFDMNNLGARNGLGTPPTNVCATFNAAAAGKINN